MLLAFLAALLALGLAAWFLSTVLLVAMEVADDTQKESYFDLFKLFWLQVWNATVVLLLSLVLALFAFGEHLAKFWLVYLSLGLLAIPAELNAAFNDEIWEAKDAGFTRFWVPVYRTVVIPLLNVVEALWRIAICAYNLVASITRVITTNAISLAFDCDGMNWGNVADRIATLFEKGVQSVFFWILSLFRDDFDLTSVLAAFGELLVEFEPLGNCWCQSTSFIIEWTVRVASSKNLHNALDRLVNVVISLGNEIAQFATALFDLVFGVGVVAAPPHSNGNSNATENETVSETWTGNDNGNGESGPIFRAAFGEDPDRAPRWRRTSEDACLTLQHTWVFVDDVIGISLDILFGVDPANVPKVGPFFGNFMCAFMILPPFVPGVDVFQIVFDALFHVDVLIAGNFWGELQDDLDPFFAHAYNTSHGIEEFWKPIGHPITDDIGCVLSALANTTIAAFEVATRVLLGIPDNFSFDELKAFIETDRIQDPAEFLVEQALLAVDCTASLMTNINEPLGDAFNETVHVIVSSAKLVAGIVLNVNEFFKYVGGSEYEGRAVELFFELSSVAVAYGNVVKQFTFTPPFPGDPICHIGGLQDPHDRPVNAVFGNIDLFCCTGHALQGLMQTLFWFLEFLVRGIGVLFDSSGFGDAWFKLFQQPGAPGDLDELEIRIKAVITGLTCFTPAMIEVVDEVLKELNITEGISDFFSCGAGFGEDLAGRLFTVYARAVELIVLTPVRLVSILIDAVGVFVGSGACTSFPNFGGSVEEDCACDLFLRFYAQTLGRILELADAGAGLASCILDLPFFENAMDTLNDLFGAPFFLGTFGGGALNIVSSCVGAPIPSCPRPGSIFWRLCGIIETIVNVIELIQLLFTDFGAFVSKLLENLADIPIVANILDKIEAIEDYFVELIDSIKDIFQCISDFIFDFLPTLPACVWSCIFFGEEDPCHACVGFSCPISFPSVPNFKRRGAGDLHDGRVNRTVNFTWDPSAEDSVCHQQYREATDETNPRLKRLLQRDAQWCFVSGVLTRLMDVALFKNADDVDRRLVNPYLFYDMGVGMEFAGNVSSAMPYISSYLLQYTLDQTNATDFNFTVVDYLKQNNASWEVTDRLAVHIEVLTRSFKALREEGVDSPGGEVMELIFDVWKYGFGWKFPPYNENGQNSKRRVPLNDKAETRANLTKALVHPVTWVKVASKTKRRIVNATGPFFAGGGDVVSGVFADWLSRSGYRAKPHLFAGLRAIGSTIGNRVRWNVDGRPPVGEPVPRGTSTQRERWQRMAERERAAATPEEAGHWRSVRGHEYPQLAYMEEGLAGARREARAQITIRNCGARPCWGDAGEIVGSCVRNDSSLFCACELSNETHGACCRPGMCSFETEGDCTGLGGVWKQGFGCDSCFALNATVGACCHDGQCEILGSASCSALDGIWNGNLSCSSDDLAKECEHCALHRVPDIDISPEILCPLAGDVTFAPCEERKCWDPVGSVVGTCDVGFDPIFFNPTCACAAFANFTGRCCVGGACFVNQTEQDCKDLGGVPTELCASCPVVVSPTLGACCHGSPGAKLCELEDEADCASLSGIWNPGKKCSSDELDPDCEFCGAQGCRQCALLVAVINDIVDLIIDCFNDLLDIRLGGESQPQFAEAEAGKERTFRQIYDPPRQFRRKLHRSVVGDGVVSIGRFVLNAVETVFNALLNFVEWLLGLEEIFRLDVMSAIDTLADFVTNDDPDDPDGLLFYLAFIVRCDVFEHPRCERGRPGLGLWPAFLWVYGILLVLLFLSYRFFPLGGAVLTILLIASLLIWLSVAYFISPACFLPLPLVPNCIVPDLVDGAKSLDVPCLPLCHVAGNQSLPSDPNCDQEASCPGEADNFHRDFPDCWAEPYNFKGPLRVLFFFLRDRLGPVFCAISETGILSAVPFVEERADFPGDPCEPATFVEGRWRWCFRNMFWFWFPMVAFFAFWFFLFLNLWLPLQIAFAAFIQLFTIAVLFLMALYLRFTRAGDKRESYWRRRDEVDFFPPDDWAESDNLVRASGQSGTKTRNFLNPEHVTNWLKTEGTTTAKMVFKGVTARKRKNL